MLRFCRKILIAILLFVLILPIYIYAETLVLKSGQKIDGKIIEQTDKYIKIELSGVVLTYWLDEIERIDGVVVSAPRMESLTNSVSISEWEIKDFLERIDIACNKMDIGSFSQTLSDDFKMVAFMGSQRIDFSRQEYIENLRQGWQSSKDYSRKFEISSIKITGTEAIVEGKETEQMTLLNGQRMGGESFQKIYLEKIKGIIKQKFIEGKMLNVF